MTARFLALLMLTAISHASEETWEVLVLQVDDRLVEPTLERGLSRYPEDLAEAIEKLRLLIPDRGVVEFLHSKVPGGEIPFRQREGKMRRYNPPAPGAKGATVGREVRWERTHETESRLLFLHSIENPTQVLETRMEFQHRLQNRWTLSAVVAWGEGALFVFERLLAGELTPPPGPSQWLFFELLDEEPGPDRDESLHRSIASAEKGHSVLLRFPDVEKEDRTVTTPRHPNLELSRSYLDRPPMDFSGPRLRFSAAPAEKLRITDTLHPRRGLLAMTLAFESGPSRAIAHKGSPVVPLRREQGRTALEALEREITHEGNSFHDKPTGKTQTYYLTGRVVGTR